MKRLDRYLLQLFTQTFLTVFVILFFIFVLQTIWLFIAELAGKNLDAWLILKFLAMSLPRIIPLVLPLSVLLASIMLFGNLSESYEFAAMKSSGISLQRAMRSLIVLILMLCVVAFIFADRVIPYAEFQFVTFRQNIARVKPALAIAEGQFSDVGNFSIKVEKKRGEKGEQLEGVTIHQTSSTGMGNIKVIKAERGLLRNDDAHNALQLILYKGYYYEDIYKNPYMQDQNLPFAKSRFLKYTINLDLSKLQPSEDQSFIGINTLMPLSDLRYTTDSLYVQIQKDERAQRINLSQRAGLNNNVGWVSPHTSLPEAQINAQTDILQALTLDQKSTTFNIAKGNIDGLMFSLDNMGMELDGRWKEIRMFEVAIQEKFVIAFSCLLMFFIGAPLGAIIRKGGLGLPMVLAMLIFIAYYFINTFGKKLAEENGIHPFWGMWMASILLSPLAIAVTYRATHDLGQWTFEWPPFLTRFFSFVQTLILRKREHTPEL